MSWRCPLNRSGRLTVPSGPSKLYSFSTAIHGIRRRSAASASRARVCSFSLTSSSSRAVFHSSGETTGGVFTLLLPPSVLVNDVHEAAPDGPLAIHPLRHLAEFLISIVGSPSYRVVCDGRVARLVQHPPKG